MQNIERFFQRYRDAFQANSAERIESHWDADEPAPFYKAEEMPDIMTDWAQLRAYWRHNEKFNSINELSFTDIVSRPMGEDRLMTGMRMRWDIRFADDARQIDGSAFAWAGQTMGGDNHVIACFRRTNDGLKLNAWIEAPDAPLLYIADLYRKNVRPDFPSR